MGSGPGSPFDLEPPGCLILEDLQTLHIPTKQETTGYFFLWWLFLFFPDNFEAKGDLKKILRKHRLALFNFGNICFTNKEGISEKKSHIKKHVSQRIDGVVVCMYFYECVFLLAADDCSADIKSINDL